MSKENSNKNSQEGILSFKDLINNKFKIVKALPDDPDPEIFYFIEEEEIEEN